MVAAYPNNGRPSSSDRAAFLLSGATVESPEMRCEMQHEVSRIQAILGRLHQLVFEKDFDFVEEASGVLMFAWGVQLMMPFSTFASTPSYAGMAGLAREPIWAGVMVWLGFTQVGSYILNHWRVRLASTFGAVLIWTFISVTIGISNPYGTGIIMYPGWVALDAWVFWRIAIEDRAA